MMRAKYILFIIASFVYFVAVSQNKKEIEKLEQKIKNAETSDNISQLELTKTYIKLSEEYLNLTPSKAYQSAKEALKIAEKENYLTEIGKSRNILGAVFYEQGVFTESINHHLEALEIFEQIRNKEGIAESNNFLGIAYFKIKKPKEAKKYYNRALKIYEEQKNLAGEAEVLGNIGFVYEKEADFDKALKYQENALNIYKKINNEAGIAIIYDNIASIYEDRGKFEIAYKYFNKAMKINEKLGNLVPLIRNYNDVGDTYRKRKMYEKALVYANEAMNLAKKLSHHYEESVAYKDLAKIYRGLKQPEKAYEYAMLYQKTYQKLFETESAKQASQMQFLFETERKDKEILAHKTEIKNKNLIQIFLISAFFLMLVFGFFVYKTSLQRKKANKKLSEQTTILEIQQEDIKKKNTHITKSIQSALTIQKAILPRQSKLDDAFPERFVIYKPKDIVSGDFYWVSKYKKWRFVAVVDCTGHGVPGAFMSMIGSTLLEKIVKLKEVRNSQKVLEMLDDEIHIALQQEENNNNDGMDMSFCAIKSLENGRFRVQFAGAKLPLCLWKKNEEKVQFIKGSRKSIGGIQNNRSFKMDEIEMQKDDILYLFSDGFIDQNNPERKKFSTQKLISLLDEHKTKGFPTQKEILENALAEHQKDADQRDDITFLAVKI